MCSSAVLVFWTMIEHHKVKVPAPLVLKYPELKPISVDTTATPSVADAQFKIQERLHDE